MSRSLSLSSTSSRLLALSSLTVAATRSWFNCSCTSLGTAALPSAAATSACEGAAAAASCGRELGVLKAGLVLAARVLGSSSCRTFSLSHSKDTASFSQETVLEGADSSMGIAAFSSGLSHSQTKPHLSSATVSHAAS